MPNIHVLIILMGLLLGRDLGRANEGAAPGEPAQFLVACVWCLIIAVIALIALPACARTVGTRGSRSMVGQGLAFAQSLRWLLVAPFAAWSVWADAVGTVEVLIGSWVGLDEMLAVAPPIMALLAISWAEYPLQDRVRQAMMMRQLDQGGLPERPPTRIEATASALRAMLAMPLCPILLIVCWHEAIELALRDVDAWIARTIDTAGTIAIVLAAPAIIVRVLGTHAFDDGQLAQRVRELGTAMGTRVRGIRLWTHASANAALLGIVPLARYVLITERLVRGAARHELDAVLAHELAHARHFHVLWILLSVVAAVGVLSIAQTLLVSVLSTGMQSFVLAESASILFVGVTVLVWFGVVSRLIERHADAHAAIVLGQEIAASQGADPGVVHPAGPACMAAALDRVCALNGIDRDRWGFRHGSVAQRQRALAALPGLSADRLPVDRHVRAVKLATLLGLVSTVLFFALATSRGWFG